MRKGVADRRGVSAERGKGICAKGGRVESKDNPVTSRCAGSRTWRTMEDSGISDEELLVARCNERYRKVCGGM